MLFFPKKKDLVRTQAIHSPLVEESYRELFPQKRLSKQTKIIYSNRFKPYGANIRMDQDSITLHLSNKWIQIDKEIQKGLIQELLRKLFKTKITTVEINLYNNFVKNIHEIVPVTNIDPELHEAFTRVNDKYFLGQIKKANLQWSKPSKTRLGSYNYKTDTIRISPYLRPHEEMLDYVMFHEMLHKFHSYEVKNGKTYYHTPKFRKLEKQFENAEKIEKQLKHL